MTNEITNGMLLEYIHAMKSDLQSQISALDEKLTYKIDVLDARVGVLDGRVGGFSGRLVRLEEKMERGFEDARLHRQALQEDLEATIRMVAKHEKKLVRR